MIPKTISYGHGRPTRVQVLRGKSLDRGKTWGDFNPGVIRLSPNQTPFYQRETLLHEILHDCAYRAGVSKLGVTRAQEELVINRITPWLLEALTRNEELVTYLGQR